MHILFAGGGTAGHINPALAVADYFCQTEPDTKISYIGTAKKLEATLVPKAGYNFRTINVAGLQRRLTVKNIGRNIVAVGKMVTSSISARKILKELKPDVVIGTGGYVSGPVLMQAAKLGIKTAIHEQNAYPGVTTKMLAPKVDRVMLAMPEAQSRLNLEKEPIITGNPVRGEFLVTDKASASKLLNTEGKIMILSFGGSLGAQPINSAVADLIAELWQDDRYVFFHSAGESGYDNFIKMLEERNVDTNAENVKVFEYIDNMSDCMAAADLIISRAGAITLTEIEAAGKASILIPSPYVAENHQYHNAMTLKNKNAAEVIEEKDLNGKVLTETARKMLSGDMLNTMGENARAMAIIDANRRIYDCIKELCNN